MSVEQAIGVLQLMREQAYQKAEGGVIAECALRMAINALSSQSAQVGSGTKSLSEASGSVPSAAQK